MALDVSGIRVISTSEQANHGLGLNNEERYWERSHWEDVDEMECVSGVNLGKG